MGLSPPFPSECAGLRQSRGLSPRGTVCTENCSGTADFMFHQQGRSCFGGRGAGLSHLSVCTGVLALLGAAGAARKSAVSRNSVTDVPGHEFFSPVLVLA